MRAIAVHGYSRVLYLLIFVFFSWLLVCIFLPFGNHLTILLSDVATKASKKNSFERVFLHKFISEKRVGLLGVECDAGLLESKNFFPVNYIESKNSSISLGIQIYYEFESKYSSKEAEAANKLVLDLIDNCDPNIGLNDTPPLVDAILAKNANFVERLLKRGADPTRRFISPSTGNYVDLDALVKSVLKKAKNENKSEEEILKIINLLKGS
ncbi:hypothetical protein [Acidovorax sp. LjRoot117]|uniref:hypothetical protein n=1 Tax=Acidovorax sp. LjRoot117 TaxID=3342255 RepID=UPI003ECCA310